MKGALYRRVSLLTEVNQFQTSFYSVSKEVLSGGVALTVDG